MRKIVVVGGGTAGLVTALILRRAFPKIQIELLESEKIGIVGVGEGSTEHWKWFMRACNIPIAELITNTKATHKNGIRFLGWTKHTPDYFHSVSGAATKTPFNIYGLYNKLVSDHLTITENMAPIAMIDDMVPANNPHESVNQYHFDTFKLNEFLHQLCIRSNITVREARVDQVVLNPDNGHISSVITENKEEIGADFWIDATGFRKELISKVGKINWISYSKHLQMNAAVAFPTESDPSGKIKPYTCAYAMDCGWMFEIPTQERRGNGYIYSSEFLTQDQALAAASQRTGYEIEKFRSFEFDPGCLDKMWIKNCVAVGLASSFVEPLEATSIGSTIQQARLLVDMLPGFIVGSDVAQNHFNKKMSVMMDNILAMVYMHYMSDREDTEMWRKQKTMQIPDYLQNLLDLWSVRPPLDVDISGSNYEMFMVPHFYHVAQGQGLLHHENSERLIDMFDIASDVHSEYFEAKLHQTSQAMIDHAESLKQIQI